MILNRNLLFITLLFSSILTFAQDEEKEDEKAGTAKWYQANKTLVDGWFN